MSTSQQAFANLFNSISATVEFDPSWANGTGYLDNATRHPMKVGEKVKSIDNHGRKIVIVGTEYEDALVLFERFKPDEYGTRSHVVVCNGPWELREQFDGVVSAEAINSVMD